jgi:hypothetical protein
MTMSKFIQWKRVLITCGVLILIGTAFFVFKNHSLEGSFFSSMPYKQLTGYDCPWRGSQRAVHFLLNGNWEKAFNYNSLLFFLLPCGFLVAFFEWISKFRNHSFGVVFIYNYLILMVLVAIVIFTFWSDLQAVMGPV